MEGSLHFSLTGECCLKTPILPDFNKTPELDGTMPSQVACRVATAPIANWRKHGEVNHIHFFLIV